MYLAGVSVRRVEGITSIMGNKVSPGTISNLNKKVYEKIESGGTDLSKKMSLVFIWTDRLKRPGREVSNVSVWVAIGVNRDGYGGLWICEGAKEDKAAGRTFYVI